LYLNKQRSAAGRRGNYAIEKAERNQLCASATLILACVNECTEPVQAAQRNRYSNWTQFEGSPDAAQYSALKQVNKTNVTQLKQVWFYPAGNNGLLFGSNPIVVDGVMFVLGKSNRI
jgi:quinoprotein glucose dehydrogenase